MYTYLYCLLAATLAARKRHDLLTMSLEEALRWLLIRGYSPFADWYEKDLWEDPGFHVLRGFLGVDGCGHVTALQALCLMENPSYDGVIQQGATHWKLREARSPSPCGRSLRMDLSNGRIYFVTATHRKVLVLGDNAIPLPQPGGDSSLLVGTPPNEGGVSVVQIGALAFAKALIGGEMLHAESALSAGETCAPELTRDGAVEVTRRIGSESIRRKVYLK